MVRRFLANDYLNPWLDDASFVGCDFFDGVAQRLYVVQANRGDCAQEGVYNVGCVNAATNTNLKDDDVAFGILIVQKCDQSDYFKESQGQLQGKWCLRHLIKQLDDFLLRNFIVVDEDALSEAAHVRRCEHATAETCFLQGCGCLKTDWALAIGTSDMNHLERVLRVAQGACNCTNVMQTALAWVASILAEIWIVRDIAPILAYKLSHAHVPSVNIPEDIFVVVQFL